MAQRGGRTGGRMAAGGRKGAKNFQGFNKSQCTYQESIQDYVFIPEDYGQLYKNQRFAKDPPDFCEFCNLAPCIMKEHEEELRGLGKKLEAEQKDHPGIRLIVFKYVNSLMEYYFGKRYVRKLRTPICVDVGVKAQFPDDDSSDDDSFEEDFLAYRLGPKWLWEKKKEEMKQLGIKIPEI